MVDENSGAKSVGAWFPKRYLLVFLLAWSAFISYVLRTNLSLAIVAMVNQTAIRLEENETVQENGQCHSQTGNGTDETFEDGSYVWDLKTQSFLQGGFFYGYTVTQILTGRLADKYGAKYLFAASMALGSIMTLLSPVAATLGPGCFMAVRVITGMSQGIVYPGTNTLFSRWVPPSERSRMYTFFNIGSNTGLLVSMPVIGWLCKHGFADGWPSVFYIFGTFGMLWVFLWLYFAYDSPEDHPTILQEEKKLILDSLPEIKDIPVPWKAILTSVPVWAYIFALSTGSWIYYTRLTELPTYINTALNMPIQENASVNTLVTASSIVFCFITGYLADFLINKRILNNTKTRKLMEITAETGCAVCLIAVILSGCNVTWVITFLTLSAGVLSFSNVGAGVIVLDMAPNFAGTVFGIANTLSAVTGFLSPLLTGYVVVGKNLVEEWHTIFYVSAGIGIVGSVVLFIFGSAEVQKWNLVDENQNEDQQIIIRKDSGE